MSATIQEASEHALWFCRYALDRGGSDGRLHHPGVASHLLAAFAQLEAAVRLAQPDMDQTIEKEAA